jgi:murein DD-endopeptidase MepM/ murein hydrolase activator NlpD
MPSPPSRVRKFAAVVTAVLLLAAIPIVSASGQSSSEDELKENKKALHETKERIRARNQRLKMNQRVMNQLATRIERTDSELHEMEHQTEKLQERVAALELELAALQAQLDERVREAYILGGSPVLYLLTATSAAEAASRISFLDEMNRRDRILADRVEETRTRLSEARDGVARGQLLIDMALQQLELDKKALRNKMAETRAIVAKLHEEVEAIQVEISRIRPFGVCPVDGPHAVGDGFGIWHHHPKKQGGSHRHQGNDIMAAMGTPLVAPFDGTAITTENFMGGKAVNVYGDNGYVYMAHLSAYEKLGEVKRGDVVGYVGTTGNASGPHVHFEWHPGNGRAVDPYDFLMMVC